MYEDLFEHFFDNDHVDFVSDVLLIFIDKTDPWNPVKRKKYWKHTLKIFASNGLNIAEYV